MPVTTQSVCSPVDRYLTVRQLTRDLCSHLELEDYIVQSMPDVSPTRWHLAHTTWFFETFLLKRFCESYQPFDDQFEFLFNSYYNSVGQLYPRAKRGLLTRPTVGQVWAYRDAVDERVAALLASQPFSSPPELVKILEIGINHEQQHQELMLTDIKHVLSCNPMFPAYCSRSKEANEGALNQTCDGAWRHFPATRGQFGFHGEGFHFDNEGPQFEQLLQEYELQDRLVTNREFLAFIQDGGYQNSEYWLSLGWNAVQAEEWQAPLYWIKTDDGWHEFTLHGLQPLDPDQPVCHVSYFEADAMARWAGCRLPTELEWEHAVGSMPIHGNFIESQHRHPSAADSAVEGQLRQCYGDVWEWTSSHYSPYPGYQPPSGALGEYNGKFMCNQFVLRGGSCATSVSHMRPTYRNFFPVTARWQFSGIRLAR